MDIEQHDVRLGPQHDGDRGVHVSRLADDLDGAADLGLHSTAEHGVIVHDDDPAATRRTGCRGRG
jgi:hypothetical protein